MLKDGEWRGVYLKMSRIIFLILLFLQTFVVSRISSTERLQTLGEQMFALLLIH